MPAFAFFDVYFHFACQIDFFFSQQTANKIQEGNVQVSGAVSGYQVFMEYFRCR